MNIICECSHPKKSHRTMYGWAGKGACFYCPSCTGLKVARYVLSIGERRILAKIAETKEIGGDVLAIDLRADNDPASLAVHAICHNLYTAGYLTFLPGCTVSATPAGRQYLQENPLRG